MHDQATRVVYENQPYIVVRGADGSGERAYGPFTPGTEPNLAECGPDTEVHDRGLRMTLVELLPLSPELPASEDTLAGS